MMQNNQNITAPASTNTGSAGTFSTNITPDVAKKKCKNFLATLMKLAFHQPTEVAQSVKNLIQGLVDSIVSPEEFTQQLQKELNSSPQPCLIPFLKKSLPYLQISLCQGETSIEGIRPPNLQAILVQNNPEQMTALLQAMNTTNNNAAANSQQINTSNIVNLTGNLNNTNNININSANHHTNVNSLMIRTPTQTLLPTLKPIHIPISTLNVQRNLGGPQTLPTSNLGFNNTAAVLSIGSTSSLYNNNIIGVQQHTSSLNNLIGHANTNNTTTLNINSNMYGSGVGPSRIPLASIAPGLNQQIIGSGFSINNSNLLSANSSNNIQSIHYLNQLNTTTLPMNLLASGNNISINGAGMISQNQNAYQTSLQPSNLVATEDAGSPMRDEDDINDVTTMGGVNLQEEKARILAYGSELVGSQIRSVGVEPLFCNVRCLTAKLDTALKAAQLQAYESDVLKLLSLAIEQKMRIWLTKLAIIAEHRMDTLKMDPRYEVASDVKSQFKFLEEIDNLERKKKKEHDKEMLFRMAKKAKHEDPEQIKLKQRAKEMQIAQLEEARQMEANMTALAAIGNPRKKRTGQDGALEASSQDYNTNSNVLNNNNVNMDVGATLPSNLGPFTQPMNKAQISGNTSLTAANQMNLPSNENPLIKNRIKRVTMRDLILMLEQDRDTRRSALLYQCYLT